jgi:hypothetical protein
LPSGEMTGPPTDLRLIHFSNDVDALFWPNKAALHNDNNEKNRPFIMGSLRTLNLAQLIGSEIV